MPTARRHTEPVTIEGFDAFIDAQADATDFELIEGVIFMTNPTETHEQIASNIGAPLTLAMDKRGCRSYQGGMWVQASDDSRGTDKYKPDIVVRCGSIGSTIAAQARDSSSRLTHPSDVLHFEAVDFRIGLETVYFAVDL